MTGFLAGLALKLLASWPWLARVPWKLLGIALLCLLLFGLGWKVRGWQEAKSQLAAVELARKEERAAFEIRDRQFAEQAASDAKLLESAAAERDLLSAELTRLRTATAALPLTRTVTKVIHADCSCPDTRLAPALRLCFNAAATGDASDLAACEAERVSPIVQSE